MKYLSAILMAVVITACQNQPENTTTIPDSSTSENLPDTIVQPVDSIKTIALHNGMQCFLYTKNRDTIAMQLLLKDSAASGSLVYNFYEKDKNKGIFKGFLKNDTLLANYTFLSEGMRSVRQVVFLLKGDIMLSGSGSMKEQNGRLVFSNKKDISFDGNLLLKPADCGTVKFR